MTNQLKYFPLLQYRKHEAVRSITEDTQTCEGKFKKTRTFDSFHNYIATTNSDWAAQVDSGDRRFAVLDCDNQWAGPLNAEKKAYFRKLHGPAVTRSFARYLYELDVQNFVPAENIPQNTDGLREQKLQSLGVVPSLVLEWLQRGYVVDKDNRQTWPEIDH